ncbi:sulfatase family protein [Humisphaera borealis]|uniref:Sulfatase n=1 Tax=Humisphaera borealis TaxID=2807512 RepID=A0A7M2WUV3_9BACT|nr:sulfatase [Humisphaera borealis]QOV89308.1 sulfatase [Humisphaera borealis]
MRYRWSALFCCVAGLLSVFAPPAKAADPKRPPNIVMIISDDQHWGDYGFMGHSTVKTPNLDRLASRSLTFKRGYVPSSLCCPSLATMITGLYPHQHLVTSNDPPMPAKMKKNDPAYQETFQAGREVMNKHLEAVQTLPVMLKNEGYLSLQTGKWWQGNFTRGGFTHGMTKGSRHGDEGLDIGRKTMEPIYNFIAEAKKADKPFMVWYAPMMPHDPHTPPEEILAKYKDKTPSLHQAKYWAMVEWFDQTCGQLVDHIDKQGLGENTIIVYLSDNGWIQNLDNPRYAPKSKQSQYDGGTRTPIMVRWSGRIQPKMSDDLAMSIDIMPTLLAALGKKPTAQMQGLNLLDDAAVKARKTITGECFTHNSQDLNKPEASLRWRWVIDGHLKLILPAKQNEQGGPELYDLAADPHETKNLADSDPRTVERLTKTLDAWWPGKV